jgi:hypothetical protein
MSPSSRVVCLSLAVGLGQAAFGQDSTQYIDPRIGSVSMLLVPTYPTFSRPNQMPRMVPTKTDYIDDQVAGFPLQVGAHRQAGVFPMKVVRGAVTADAWRNRMPSHPITSPVITKTTIRLPGGGTFRIRAPGASRERKFIQRARLNGQPLDTPFISHAAIMQGGTLELEPAELPNRAWGLGPIPGQ